MPQSSSSELFSIIVAILESNLTHNLSITRTIRRHNTIIAKVFSNNVFVINFLFSFFEVLSLSISRDNA